MASLARVGGVVARVQRAGVRPWAVRAAAISTSKGKKDTATLVETAAAKETPAAAAANKNWVSWGFDRESEVEDNTVMHATFFVSITLCLVTLGFIWTYLPDYRMVDWAQREAYLELRRREAEGLPLIDPNLIPLDKCELPEDEELGETEIII